MATMTSDRPGVIAWKSSNRRSINFRGLLPGTMVAGMACVTATLAMGSPALAIDGPGVVGPTCGRWMANPVFEDDQWRSKTPQEIEGGIDYSPQLPGNYSADPEFNGSDDYPDDKWRVFVQKHETNAWWEADKWSVGTTVDIKPLSVDVSIETQSWQGVVSRQATARYNRTETEEWVAFDEDLAACPPKSRRVYASSNLIVSLRVALSVAIDVGDHSAAIATAGGFVSNSLLPDLKKTDRGLTASVTRDAGFYEAEGRFSGTAGGGAVRGVDEVGGNLEVDVQANYTTQAAVRATGNYVGNVVYTLRANKTTETADMVVMQEKVTVSCQALANSVDDSILNGNERSSMSTVSCGVDFGTDVR